MILALILWFYSAVSRPQVLASHNFSLEDRYDNTSVNQVFKDNILLTLAYLDGRIGSREEIDWETIERPFHAEFTLKPGESFAFHDKVLKDYSGRIVKTTNAHFIAGEGFKSDGYLVGDGVCHLASLIYWVAKDAGLTTYRPSNHDFAKINEVPKEYGVGILSPNPLGNLYVVNNLSEAVTFSFDFDGQNLSVTAVSGIGKSNPSLLLGREPLSRSTNPALAYFSKFREK